MKQILLAVGVAAICSVGVLAADDNVQVRLTGCVLDGDNSSFVLTNAKEMSGGRMIPTASIYWLSTTKGLKAQVGHTVEVTGTFSPSRDEGKTGTIKINSDRATDQQTIKVEHDLKKAEASTSAGVAGAIATTGVKAEITKPYRRLEVKSLKMIARSCS